MDRTFSQFSLREELRDIVAASDAYFAELSSLSLVTEDAPFVLSLTASADEYWKQIPADLQRAADETVTRLLAFGAKLAEAARTSTLAGPEDVRDVKISVKTMRAALRLRSYQYIEADFLHDEGSVLGLRPASQSEAFGLTPQDAAAKFSACTQSLAAVVRIVEATAQGQPLPMTLATPVPAKYRAGTAFIMMWMDPKHPDLTDVADAVRTVFRTFDVRAVRADDIEHEGLISERVLNEIRTAEFLFADLTGMRPNVYYEVGFAHALGKRVILFRKSGTGVHFDLAGYNCPEYENLRDLREKLSRRLVSLTNKYPSSGEEI
jgi:hypothetical protein